MIQQFEIQLPDFKQGFHLITDIILKKINNLPENGLLNIIINHTSAAITLNENADYSVRTDFNNFISRLVPENISYFEHTYEGSDDMPAHIKSSLIGQTLTIPIYNGKLKLGIWQGIYLCEFRRNAGKRKLFITIMN